MATGTEVLEMLIPQGGWAIRGDDYDQIEFLECDPITEAQFLEGFAKVDLWKAIKEAEKASTKQAILDRIGLTSEEVSLILG